MAHFAKLNENNVVIDVCVVNNNELLDENGQESEIKGIDFLISLLGHQNWKQTSYNGKFRKNYAAIGYSYDPIHDAFISPQPFSSWNLDPETCKWIAPIEMPQDGKVYRWNEETMSWLISEE